MKFKEVRTLSAYKLRKLCIEAGWYTCGDNEEYDNLFSKLYDDNGCPAEITTDLLAEIAYDIYHHSDHGSRYTVKAVMYEIAKACDYEFTAA